MRVTFLLSTFLALASGQFFYYPHNFAYQNPVVSTFNHPNSLFFQPTAHPVQVSPKFRFASVGDDTETDTVDAPAPAVQVVAAVPAPVYTAQPADVYHSFHSQDDTGAYSFGYSGGSSSKHEVRDSFGNVFGAFNYVDADGKIQRQQYTAGADGFKVAATNLPSAPVASPLIGPTQVEETPEVQKARAEHVRLFDIAAKAAAASPVTRRKRSADPAFAYSTTHIVPSTYHGQPANFYRIFGDETDTGSAANVKPMTYKSPVAFNTPLTYSAANLVPATNFFPSANFVPATTFSHPLTFASPNVVPTFRFAEGTDAVKPMTYTAAATPTHYVASPFFSAFPFNFANPKTPFSNVVTVNKVVHSPGKAETVSATN